MRLYLLRHGIAEDGIGMPDPQRRLTDEGIAKLRRVLTRASEAGVRPDVILTSPYVRARQTAAIAVEELAFANELVETEELTPYADPRQTWQELRNYRDAEHAMVVGHNPHLSDFASLLLGAPGGSVEMKKAGLACFDLLSTGPAPRGSLCWLLTAKSAGV